MRRATLIVLAVVFVLGLAAVPALAGRFDNVPEKSKLPVLPTVFSLVGLAGIAAVGFKHAKRTHLD